MFTAILNLIDTLGIAGGTVTIDAMDWQKNVEKIREKKVDYALGLKGQPTIALSGR